MVRWDVVEGKVSVTHAAEAYGVVVRCAGPLPGQVTVDAEATAALRHKRVSEPGD